MLYNLYYYFKSKVVTESVVRCCSRLKNSFGPLFIVVFFAGSCNYLDIVPDNIATVDNAFKLRSQAEKYLFTCYSYLPKHAQTGNNPALLSGDEVWFYYPYKNIPVFRPPENWEIARDNQNILNPYLNFWDGYKGGISMFQAIRDCNIFLDNIDKVPDMTSRERARWTAEVKFLKAYYHWFLLRMYGPIPIIDQNLPVSSDISEVQVIRQPVDECFSYIIDLLDASVDDLPETILNPVSEMGRITKPIVLAIKARILMNAASPLFNGNTDYSFFTNAEGEPFFNQQYQPEKWQKAADACLDAIEASHATGHKLYYFRPLVDVYNLGPELQTQMNIRNTLAEKWNSEIIWGSTNSMASEIQAQAQAILDPSVGVTGAKTTGAHAMYAPPIKIAEMYYTANGVPIDEDRTWDYHNRYEIDTASLEDSLYIYPGYETAKLNFDREERFYAGLGFDGGVWYGQGKYDQEDLYHLEGRLGSYSGKSRGDQYSITGYFAKKLVNFLNVIQTDATYQVQSYPWPIIRLADLYLYYAEALNEVGGPSPESLKWINMVRERAGLTPVEEAWPAHSNNPEKFTSQEGLREIIHQERLIEMAFEGGRYWDLRRWKEAERTLSQPITGWDINQENPIYYYQPVLLFNQSFEMKDYFWPIREHDLIVNKKLIQNPGW